MSFLDTYIFKNPMLAEVHRVRKQFLSFRGPSIVAFILILIVGAGYFSFLVGIFQNRQDFDGGLLIVAQSCVLCLGIPIFFSSSIAGEREKRTWEVLTCAPVTKAQIVAGKVISASMGIGVAACFNFLPILILLGTTSLTHFYKIAELEANSFALTSFLVALTLFISTRSRSHYAALGTAMASVFMLMVGIPIFIGIALSGQDVGPLFTSIHPVVLQATLSSEEAKVTPGMQWAQFSTLMVLAVALVYASVKTVNAYDHVKRKGKQVSA